MKIFVLSLLCLIHQARSHSWIACSDYTEKNGDYWDASKCRGYPRDAHIYAQKDKFGLDRGFDYKPAPSSKGCKTMYSGTSYNSEYPKAVYFPGQQVVIVHPMKNHGADVCTNQYIPDFGNKIYRGRKDVDKDQSFSFYRQRLVADLGISPTGYQAAETYKTYPKPGYQNAPKFCENTDKSMGTYSFNVPSDLEAGDYTFVWRWSFNGPEDIYATCFDVTITQNKQERDNILAGRGLTTSVACGGIISDGTTRGSVRGCDDVVLPPSPPTTTRAATTPARVTTTTRSSPTNPTATRTTTTPAPQISEGAVYFNQVQGEVQLTPAQGEVKLRYVSVQFSCAVEANFWNARQLGVRENRIYELLQEQPDQIASNKVFFTASFPQSCNLATHPIYASIVLDD